MPIGADERTSPTLDARSGAALSWAAVHVPFTHVRIVSDMPHGSVYHLTAGRHSHYLKAVAAGGRELAVALALRAAGIADCVPRMVVAEPEQRFILFEGGGGIVHDALDDARLLHSLSAYGSLQRRAPRHGLAFAGLPRLTDADIQASIDEWLAGLIAHLPTSAGDSAQCPQRERTDLVVSLKGGLHALAEDLIPHAIALEHNDLHGGNIAFDEGGRPCIFDWNDALVAPIGFSLGVTYGSSCDLRALAQAGINPAFEHYLMSWQGALDVDASRLRRHLQAAAALGLVRLGFELGREFDAGGRAFGHFYLPRIRFIVADLLASGPPKDDRKWI